MFIISKCTSTIDCAKNGNMVDTHIPVIFQLSNDMGNKLNIPANAIYWTYSYRLTIQFIAKYSINVTGINTVDFSRCFY